MGRILKFSLLGCGGLIGLFVVIGIIGAIFGTGDETGQQADRGQAGQQNQNEQGWNQAEGEVYRGEDPSLYLRSFDSQEEFENFVDEEKAKEERQAERERQQAEQAQQDAVEEQAQAEREQQEAEEAQQDAGGAAASEEEPQADSVTIRVTGESGQAFSGSYGNVDTTQSVDGTVPTEYEQEVDMGAFSADSVSAVMQKNSAGPWELGVQILVDGEVVKETSTTAEFGVAQVTWSSLDE